jgi:hypothetical protein
MRVHVTAYLTRVCDGEIQKKSVLGRAELRTAMNNLEPPIKYKQADTLDVLSNKIIESMREKVDLFPPPPNHLLL